MCWNILELLIVLASLLSLFTNVEKNIFSIKKFSIFKRIRIQKTPGNSYKYSFQSKIGIQLNYHVTLIILSLRKCRLNKYFWGFTPLACLEHYEALNYSKKYQRQKICISSESLKIIYSER